MSSSKEVSPSKAVAAKTIYEAFSILKEAGGQLTGKELMDKLSQRVQFTDWERIHWKKRET